MCGEALLDQPGMRYDETRKWRNQQKQQKEAIGWRLIKHTGSLHKKMRFYALFHLFVTLRTPGNCQWDRSQVAPGRKEVVEAPSICPEFQDHLINDKPQCPIGHMLPCMECLPTFKHKLKPTVGKIYQTFMEHLGCLLNSCTWQEIRGLLIRSFHCSYFRKQTPGRRNAMVTCFCRGIFTWKKLLTRNILLMVQKSQRTTVWMYKTL